MTLTITKKRYTQYKWQHNNSLLQCYYAECRYTECCYAEGRGARNSLDLGWSLKF
jgi:hypothetical protein